MKLGGEFLEGVFNIIIMYITWQGIGLNEYKLNWWCVYVYRIVDEIGHFDLLVFWHDQRVDVLSQVQECHSNK
jgi:hypothetical protein